MSIKDDPNRVVRTKDSTIAFIGHNQQANEDVLIEAIVDAASNEVKWRSSSHARKGIDFVEANESLQGIIDDANANLPGNVTTPVPAPPEEQPGPESNEQPTWQRLGFKNEDKWRKAGSPQG